MGVPGLWKLLSECCVDIKPEDLCNKIVAIDVSVWLHQSAKMATKNSHIRLMFLRCCKLLYYGIKPVFVFDGPSPFLKKSTLRNRRQKREANAARAKALNDESRMKKLESVVYTSLLTDGLSKSIEPQLTSDNGSEETDIYECSQNTVETTFSSSSGESDGDEILDEFGDSQLKRFDSQGVDFSKFQIDRLLSSCHVCKHEKCKTTTDLDLPTSNVLSVTKLASDEKTFSVFFKLNADNVTPSNAELVSESCLNTEQPSVGLERLQLILGNTSGSQDASMDGHQESTTPDSHIIETYQARSSEHLSSQISEIESLHDNQKSGDETSSLGICHISTTSSEVADYSQEHDKHHHHHHQKHDDLNENNQLLVSSPQAKIPCQDAETACVPLSSIAQVHTDTVMNIVQHVTDPNVEDACLALEIEHFAREIRDETQSKNLANVIDNSSKSDAADNKDYLSDSDNSDYTDFIEVPLSEPCRDEKLPVCSPGNSENDIVLNDTERENILRKRDQADWEAIELKEKAHNKLVEASPLIKKIVDDIKKLLDDFGIPHMQSASEAESQCAYLNSQNLVDAVITDDSDSWLFGVNCLIRKFFNRSRPSVPMYSSDVVRRKVGFNQEDMICLAMLSGCDYYKGIESVGMTNAVKILRHFKDSDADGFSRLVEFKRWWGTVQANKDVELTSEQRKWAALVVNDDFPPHCVYQAFAYPDIRKKIESFEWRLPNADSIRLYMKQKLGWSDSNTGKYLMPAIERSSKSISRRTNLDAFFLPKISPLRYDNMNTRKSSSKRSSTDEEQSESGMKRRRTK